MTWDDDSPYPPFLPTHLPTEPMTHEDTHAIAQLTPIMRRAFWLHMSEMFWQTKTGYRDSVVMLALTQQAQRGVKPAARPLALWLEKTQ